MYTKGISGFRNKHFYICHQVYKHFHLLLKNQWAKFNQTWLKVFLCNGDLILFKFLLQNHKANFNPVCHKATFGKCMKDSTNEDHARFHRGDTRENTSTKFKKDSECFNENQCLFPRGDSSKHTMDEI